MDFKVVGTFFSYKAVTAEQAKEIFDELYNLKTLGCTGISVEVVKDEDYVSAPLYQMLDYLKEIVKGKEEKQDE